MSRFTPLSSRPLRSLAPFAFALAFAAAIPAPPAAGQSCGDWTRLETPNPGSYINRLLDIAVLSGEDAWSVGYQQDDVGPRRPPVLRWDGAAWEPFSIPDTGHLGTQPQTSAVGAAPNGDVWIAGQVATSYPTDQLPLLLRWRDGSWDFVETATLRPQTVYPFAARGGRVAEIDILSADDIWAVGAAVGFGDAQATTVGLALHWDGSEWTDVDVPRVANRHHELLGIEAISRDDAWAVGDYRNIGDTFRGVTYHWNGSSWSHVHSPIEGMSGSSLSDVRAVGPNDVWAVGSGNGGVIVMRWDGSSWGLMPAPPLSGGQLAAAGPDDIWASGWYGFHHWDGASWSEVDAPSIPGAAYEIRGGGMELAGNCDIWSAGFYTEADGLTSYSLVERLQSASAAIDELARGDRARASRISFANPFHPGGEIRFDGAGASGGRAQILDLRGRVVRTLLLPAEGKNSASAVWDGRRDGGAPLSSGLYFVRAETAEGEARRKMILLGR